MLQEKTQQQAATWRYQHAVALLTLQDLMYQRGRDSNSGSNRSSSPAASAAAAAAAPPQAAAQPALCASPAVS